MDLKTEIHAKEWVFVTEVSASGKSNQIKSNHYAPNKLISKTEKINQSTVIWVGFIIVHAWYIWTDIEPCTQQMWIPTVSSNLYLEHL